MCDLIPKPEMESMLNGEISGAWEGTESDCHYQVEIDGEWGTLKASERYAWFTAPASINPDGTPYATLLPDLGPDAYQTNEYEYPYMTQVWVHGSEDSLMVTLWLHDKSVTLTPEAKQSVVAVTEAFYDKLTG